MDLNLFIAGKIGKRTSSGGKLSKISNIIATVSVGISVAVMIIAIAIANGFRGEIREKASGFNGDITLSAPGIDITNHLYPIKPLSFTDKIDSLPQVERIQPVAYRTALLKSDTQIQGVLVKGVDDAYNMEFFANCLTDGELPDYSIKKDSAGRALPASNDILISRRLADMLDFKIGDKVLTYFVEDDVQLRRFNVKGIFNAQLDELDKSLVIADMRHISRVNGWKNGELSGYEIILKDKGEKSVTASAQEIEEILCRHTGEDDDSVVANTLEDKFYILFDWLHLLDVNVFVILALMVAVAGFNMISGLLIILFERISQIGLLKAIGMRNKDIAGIFLWRASFIVMKGLLAGNAIALLFCWIENKYKLIELDPVNYFVSYVPIDISLFAIIAINLIAFAIIMVTMLVPCMLISKVSPSKTLSVS